MSSKIKTQLSPRQLLFLQNYLKIGNATQALIKAGYKTKYPDRAAFQLMSIPKIKTAIEKHREIAEQKIAVDFAWKLNKLKEIALTASKPQDKISAIEVMNKMQGDNAPEKHHNTNLNIDATLEDVRLISDQYYGQSKLDKD